MLRLCYSNRLEALVAPLAEAVGASMAADPMRRITIVSPNRAVEQFVRFQIAERLGIAANLRFTFVTQLLRGPVEASESRVKVLDVDALQLLLFQRLRDPDRLPGPAFEALRAYLAVAPGQAERDQRALQLSAQLARLFEEYTYSRRAMTREWPKRSALQHTAWARAESWQRALWNLVFGPAGVQIVPVDGRPMDEPSGQIALLDPDVHRLLPDAIATVGDARLRALGQLHIFGLSYVAPTFAEIFQRIAAAGAELNIYALNPCFEFWEDLETNPNLAREARVGLDPERWARQGDKVDDLEVAEDPFTLDAPGDTPALRLWGRPGREHIRLLNQLSDCTFVSHFRDPAEGREPTLLETLQQEILVRAKERPPCQDAERWRSDRSIRFIEAPGARREVEIVENDIRARLQLAEANGEDLRLHEIAVMVADGHRSSCFTHIESVFGARAGLPFNIIDRPLSGQSRVVEGLDRLLDLPLSAFGKADVFRVVSHPAIGGADPTIDLEGWRSLVDETNTRFGADFEDLKDTYIDRDIYSWDQSLRRIALGTFLAGERSGEDGIFTAGERQLLPLESSGDIARDAGRLVQLTRRLIADARACQQAQLPIREWAKLLSRLASTYLTPTSIADETALGHCLQGFERMAEADLEGGAVPFAVARDLAGARLRGLESGRGQHQADGVVISSLLPMRAVPFKLIYVLGLGEGEFPARERNNPLDLRHAQRRAGDVSPAQRDRYLFLETLLACRKELTLSYVSRDARTGDRLEPSAVVRELQYILGGHMTPDTLATMVIHHPVSASDRAYTEQPALGGRSLRAERAARARALRGALTEYLGHQPPPYEVVASQIPAATREALSPLLRQIDPPKADQEDATQTEAVDRIQLPLSALRRFLESPLQGAARYMLGLSDDEANPLEETLDEPLSLHRHVTFTLLRDAFWAGDWQLDAMQAHFDTAFERRVLKGDAPVGLFGELRRQEAQQVLDTWQSNMQQLTHLSPPGDWRRLAFGHTNEGTDVEVLPPLRLTVPLHGKPVAVELTGGLLPVQPNHRAALRCLSGGAVDAKHFLPGFLTLIALNAAGLGHPGPFGVVVNPIRRGPPGRIQKVYQMPPPQACRDWLATLCADLLSGMHAYRLPIEAVLKWRRDSNDGRNLNTRIWIERDGFDSSRYGPIHAPWAFPTPESADAYAIISRRFGFWFNCET